MKKKFCLIFFVILNILLISCKEKKIDETNESDFVSLNKEIETVSDDDESMYKTFPIDFPSHWVSYDGKIRFTLEDGLKVTKKYYLLPPYGLQTHFAVGLCHYSCGSDGKSDSSIILEPPKADCIDFVETDCTPEEQQAVIDYLFPKGEPCVIQFDNNYTNGGRKGAYVYKESAFFNSFFSRDDPDYVNPNERESLEPMPLVEKGFSIEDSYIVNLSSTFDIITLSDGKIVYSIGEDTNQNRPPVEVNYQFTHIDGMPFIKMEKAFPKEFLEANLYQGENVNPDDKILFLVCNTRDLGIQALGFTRADVPSYMIIEPRWKEMSNRIYRDATSHLIEKNGKEYPISNLCEMDSETPWIEGAQGYGIGESFIIENTWGTVYKTLLLMNGFISYEKPYLYKQNGRIKKIKVTGLNSGKEKVLDILDTPHPQSVDISFITEPEDVRVTIEDVYPGTKYEDTCIHFMITSLTEAVPYELSVK